MRRFKHIARAAVAVLAASVGVAVLPQPAAAVTLPPLKFAAVSLAPNLTYPQHLVSQKDGGVTVGDCGSGISNDGFQQYSTTGTLAQNAANTVSGRPISFCDKQAAVGADGTVYTVAFNPSTNKEVLLAFQGGTQQWMYAPPCATISAVELGTNGNIYMLANGSSACSGQRLLGIEPTLATGQTTPTVVANTILYRNLPYRGGLSPYSGGVIVRYLDGVGFFTYTGTQQQEYTVPAGAYDGGPFATVNGWAMVPILDEAPRPFNCSNDTQAAEYVVAYSVSGVVWSNQLPDCTRVDALRPMPDGGVVAMAKLRDNNLQTLTQHFVGIAPETGQAFRWTSGELAPEAGTVQSSFAFVTDLNGNLVVQRQVKRRDNSDGLDYGEVTIGVSSGYTGIGFGETKFAGDSSDGYGFMAQSGFGLVPNITNGRVYAALTECNGYSNCTNSTTKLYAASVPGMAMDYPRGAVLKYNELWLDMVVAGDSFSSGLGAGNYNPATTVPATEQDYNECYRSGDAYYQRLLGLPGLRLASGGFVACAGARTEHVVNTYQYDNQPDQSTLLTSSVDVVVLTIGGNDVDFGGFAKACLFGACDGTPYNTVINAIENDLPAKLEGAYNTIRNQVGSQTRILVLGYPHLVGPITSVASCDPLDVNEIVAARSVVQHLNQEIHTAVALADVASGSSGPRFEFVSATDADSPFKDHELCTSEPYFHNLAPLSGSSSALAFESYHPNAKGQDAYAQTVIAHLSVS